jgi:hypothetical protein
LPRDADCNANAVLAKSFHATGNSVAAADKKQRQALEFFPESMSTQRGTRLETALMSPFQQAVSRVGLGLGFQFKERNANSRRLNLSSDAASRVPRLVLRERSTLDRHTS